MIFCPALRRPPKYSGGRPSPPLTDPLLRPPPATKAGQNCLKRSRGYGNSQRFCPPPPRFAPGKAVFVLSCFYFLIMSPHNSRNPNTHHAHTHNIHSTRRRVCGTTITHTHKVIIAAANFFAVLSIDSKEEKNSRAQKVCLEFRQNEEEKTSFYERLNFSDE